MKHTIRYITAFAVMVAAGTANAGLIGENYAGAGLGYGKIEGGPDGWLSGLVLNMPVSKADPVSFDVQATYTYSRLTDTGFRARSNELGVSLIAYADSGFGKPFISLDTGWSWDNMRAFGFKSRDDSWFYGFSAGAEFKVADGFSLTPSVSWARYNDYKADGWTFGLTAHYWFTDRLGGAVGYGFGEGSAKVHAFNVGLTYRY
jgi:hypothetical protein